MGTQYTNFYVVVIYYFLNISNPYDPTYLRDYIRSIDLHLKVTTLFSVLTTAQYIMRKKLQIRSYISDNKE